MMGRAAIVAVMQVGEYISPWKVLGLLLVVFAWGRLFTWIDKDSKSNGLPRVWINLAFMVISLGAFALFFVTSGFGLAILFLLLIVIAETGGYLGLRYATVGLGDLTGMFRDWVHGFQKGPAKVKEVAGQVMLVGKDGAFQPPPAEGAPEANAVQAIQVILHDPLKRGAEQIDLAPGDPATISFAIDGVSYRSSSLEKPRAAAAIQYLKRLAGLDLTDRRKPQSGKFKISLDGQRTELEIHTAGSTAGESLHLIVEPSARHLRKLEEMGFSEDQLQALQASRSQNRGVVLVATPKGQGLTSLLYGLIRSHDAFTTHIVTVERAPEVELEGITQNPLPVAAPPAEEAKMVAWVTSQQPDTLLVSSLEDPKSAVDVIHYAAGERRAYVGLRAGSTLEALAAWRKLVGDDKLAMSQLAMIVSGRLLRRLCPSCKVAYAPDPGTLRKLNMDPGRVSKLYQARTEPLKDPRGNAIRCEVCQELRYKGRLGVFEILPIDDEIRQIVESGGTANQLKAAFRKQRGRFLQEEALSHVEQGQTSIQEVLRVLRSDDRGADAARAPAPAAVKPSP